MTGILEQILAELQAIKAAVGAPGVTQLPATTGLAINGSGQPVQTPAVDPMAGFTTPAPTPALQPPAQVQVTDEMVMKLVSDNVGNEQVKAAMKAVLNSMGIPSLPETRPDQLPMLYQQLMAVVTQHGGNIGAAVPASSPPPGLI